MSRTLHIVLHRPEIPNNTGAIGRTCVATGCALHLIHPIGFDTSEKACRRAGLDYWARLSPREHASWTDYLASAPVHPARRWFFSTRSARPLWSAHFRAGDHLVFGSETAGLPADLLRAHPDQALTLPMLPAERSLNLANAACAAVYEALRQLVSRGERALDGRARLTIENSASE